MPRPSEKVLGRHVPLRIGARTQAGAHRSAQGLINEPCASKDCEGGEIDPAEPEAVVRFSLGYLQYVKIGPLFHPTAKFYDGKAFKFVHSLCALDHKVPIHALDMWKCSQASCRRQFFSMREPKEGCIFIELGDFDRADRGFMRFHARYAGAVHWACARVDWDWVLFRGLMGR